jgi:hypothetical protein
LRERTFELIADARCSIQTGEAILAYRHYLALHRFFALLLVETLVPYEKVTAALRPLIFSTFEWVINFLRDCVLPDFQAALKENIDMAENLGNSGILWHFELVHSFGKEC